MSVHRGRGLQKTGDNLQQHSERLLHLSSCNSAPLRTAEPLLVWGQEDHDIDMKFDHLGASEISISP